MKVKLGDICDILDSQRVPVTAKDRKKGTYPYYGANGIQDYVDGYIFDDELVLLAEDGGNFGSKEKPIAYRVSGKCWVNNHAHVLKPKETVDVDYLCYSLMFYDVSKLIKGATRQKLTQNDMRKMEIKLPDLIKQKNIVSVLNKIFNLIDLRKQELLKLDELIKSRFIELFGDVYLNSKNYPIIKLENIANIISGITKGRKIKEQVLEEVPYMAVSNVKDGYIDWTNIKTILATKEEIDKYRLYTNDILMTEGGDPDKLGRGAILHTTLKNCIHQNHIFRVRLDCTKVLPIYFSMYLKQPKAKQYFLKCAKQTTGIATINMTQLRSLPVIIPPIEIQSIFGDFIERIDKSKAEIQNSLAKLETLKKSLMQEYFA